MIEVVNEEIARLKIGNSESDAIEYDASADSILETQDYKTDYLYEFVRDYVWGLINFDEEDTPDSIVDEINELIADIFDQCITSTIEAGENYEGDFSDLWSEIVDDKRFDINSINNEIDNALSGKDTEDEEYSDWEEVGY